MRITKNIRELVRLRAGCACEFCGVSETDTGGELMLDHYHPQSKGGTDDLENLLYCCTRCNLYKHDYYPSAPSDPILWNPQTEPASNHFMELEDGRIQPLTPTGAFTIQRLRLNRPQLIEHRLAKKKALEEYQLLKRLGEIISLLSQLNAQLSLPTEEQQKLLEEQQRLLRLLIKR